MLLSCGCLSGKQANGTKTIKPNEKGRKGGKGARGAGGEEEENSKFDDGSGLGLLVCSRSATTAIKRVGEQKTAMVPRKNGLR